MGLSLVVGPAHAGKIALLLKRYLELQASDPWLIVPNRAEVDAVERDLLGRRGALLAGRIVTFDDLFTTIAAQSPERRRVVAGAERSLLVRRAVPDARLNGLSASSRSPGFTDTLQSALGEIDAALVEAAAVDGDLGELHTAYHRRLDALAVWDRDALRRHAVERLVGDLGAWDGAPVLAYGFEDLTGAEWSLLEALAARADVTVSIPYEPGRAAFASLRPTVDDLTSLAAGDVVELRPEERGTPDALLHLERRLFEDDLDPADPPAIGGAIRFLEGAGARGTLELVGDEILGLLRDGTPADRIGVVCDSVDRWRAPATAVLPHLGIPFAVESRQRLSQTPLGHALHALLRFAWSNGTREDLFAFLRSPFSGVPRHAVDFVEGRLRGRAVSTPERVESEWQALRGSPLPLVDGLREAADPLEAVRALVTSMLRAAHGVDRPRAVSSVSDDLRALDAVTGALDELARVEPTRDEVTWALERITVRGDRPREPGRVAILDLQRARTRSFDVVFVLGLEQGGLPRRARPSPFLDEDRRRALGGRLDRPEPVSRDRYLFYTACTRAEQRLVLVREAADDDGKPREPGPFWAEVTRLFDADDVRHWTRRRPLAALTWGLEAAPTDRERLRATAVVAATDRRGAEELGYANGWSRQIARALNAFARPTVLRNEVNRAQLGGRTSFGVTELERYADCSSAWLFERQVDPKRIDAEPDAMLRGQVAHTTLNRFYNGLPRELGHDRVTPETLDRALAFLNSCLEAAFETGVRLDLSPLQAAELRESLRRDLEAFVRDEAASKVTFSPRRFETAFGSERAAPELQRGLVLAENVTVTGKIDRIDYDPFGARGIVQDYKSGKSAPSASAIDRDHRLQIPLYMLVLRDLVGIEPLGGVYRALAGTRAARGMLRADASEELPGFSRDDYLDEEAFWEQVDAAAGRATEYAGRIQSGDVRHDPRGGTCPTWCDLWPMCRVERS